ncbi:DNA uptake porin HofQ [Obesumbacterium proteus]|uniref:DNA uptake porin HofQ n=1 Tax=Obesumbacterium proteus TaxID=82983 RepID=UPI000621C892|nr:DNA uptake porin HofQ [Obesumbacterium proteus]KKI42135.1 porin [Obesumbacterium proteus]MCE9885498.1 DNA uptake porin HofQ [Obesumbacterium proteus]MCE9915863.1 DNA uptake porin HofQ [Obesumbacterium proteus]MCE9930282.1 DNA uptake porin HofQ [Obesumbacterium proteus]MCG2875305.1 DNA uptake porin HofQ [Obesumbacterium proteus]
MKKVKKEFWYGCLLWLSAFSALSAPPRDSAPITLTFFDAPLVNVLQALADNRHLNLMVSDEVKGNTSVKLVDVPWQRALQAIARMNQLSIEQTGNILFVQTAESVDRHLELVHKKQQQEKDQEKTSVSIALQQADVDAVVKSLTQQKSGLLSAQGSISADPRTNTILVRDFPENTRAAQAWIAELDQPVSQVQLTAHIVTINRESLNELGIRWGTTESEDSATSDSSGFRLNQFNMGLPVEGRAFNAGFQVARIGGRLLELELSALEKEDNVEIIASPHLMATNLQTASIKQGTEIPYEVSSGASGSTSIEFKEAVLGMEVTPRVMRNGKITLMLQITQNMPGRSIKQGDGEALAIDKQEIKTQVTLNDGETVILGGIFQRQTVHGKTQVPKLGDVPLLGALFRDSTEEAKRRELVIFITPRLVKTEMPTALLRK